MLLAFLVLIILLSSWVKGTNAFADFTPGATNGIRTMMGILPTLIGLFAAITVFRASGAMEFFVSLLAPVGKIFGVDSSLIPLMLMRPVSGSASLSILQSLTAEHGPDSYVARSAAVMMGSTETVFYTMAVYLGGTKHKKIPGVLPAALAANFVSSLLACWLCA